MEVCQTHSNQCSIFYAMQTIFLLFLVGSFDNLLFLSLIFLNNLLGAAVKLLPCDHEVTGSSPGNSLLQRCRERLRTKDPKWSDTSLDPAQAGATCTGLPLLFFLTIYNWSLMSKFITEQYSARLFLELEAFSFNGLNTYQLSKKEN